MQNYLLKSMPPQAIKIYRLLESGRPLTAKQIGRKLHIFPHAVYRAVKNLLETGLVDQTVGRPLKYQTRGVDMAIGSYFSIINQNFQELFGNKSVNGKRTDRLELAFIRNRTDLLKMVNLDIDHAKYSADLMVSGHEVPAETIRTDKRALDRGVRVRILSQRFDPESEHMYRNMQKMGFEVKYGANMDARIFIVDRKIVYFTSYEVKNREKAIGMRFAYAPYARLMSNFFEQKWEQAKEY